MWFGAWGLGFGIWHAFVPVIDFPLVLVVSIGIIIAILIFVAIIFAIVVSNMIQGTNSSSGGGLEVVAIDINVGRRSRRMSRRRRRSSSSSRSSRSSSSSSSGMTMNGAL